MKIKVWCDSGANIHSRREAVLDLEEDLGFEPEDWSELSDEAKFREVRDWLFQHGLEIDWQELD
jgi:hypothetical protein